MNIYSIFIVAKHIHRLNIDDSLQKEDATLVNDITLVNMYGKYKNFY